MATAKKKSAKPVKKKAKKKAKAPAKKKAAPAKKKAKKAPPPAKKKAAPAKKPAKAKPAKAKPAKPSTPPRSRSSLRRNGNVERDRSRFLHDGEHFGVAEIKLHAIGQLELTSGTIVTCDPFIVDGPALSRSVTPGSYPVSLAVATFLGDKTKGDQRVAAATVHFREGVVARWEVAELRETTSKRGADPGFPVDAGTACFMDEDAQTSIKAEPTYWPTESQKALEHQLLTDHYTHIWGWALYQPDPASKANCVAFMSGYGDGVYSSYWGLDDSGAPVCLTTDFDVFTDEDWTAVAP